MSKQIQNPTLNHQHLESWKVYDCSGELVAVLEIGQFYESMEHALYRLKKVFHHTNRVEVDRIDCQEIQTYHWHIDSLINSCMKLHEEPQMTKREFPLCT